MASTTAKAPKNTKTPTPKSEAVQEEQGRRRSTGSSEQEADSGEKV
jgi:hypothetical protein